MTEMKGTDAQKKPKKEAAWRFALKRPGNAKDHDVLPDDPSYGGLDMQYFADVIRSNLHKALTKKK